MTANSRSVLAFSLTGLVLAGIPTVIAATSSTVTDSAAVVTVALGVLLTWGVGLLMWVRAQNRRIARLLFGLAAAYAVRGLPASDDAWVYTLARALGQIAEFLLVWVMLAFPSGRLRSARDRVIVAAAGVAATVLWIPVVLFSETIPLSGPLVPCGADCPANALLVADNPLLAESFLWAFRLVGVVVLIATAASLLDRLFRASALTRRTLAPVLVVSILRTLAIAGFVATGGSFPSGAFLVALYWAVPLSMALGLLLGRLYTAAALQRLVSGLQRRPDADELRAVMADVLEDHALEIAYWLPERGRWVDAAGVLSEEPPEPGRGRSLTFATERDGRPLASILHDEALLEQPALLEAVTASTRLALEGNRLQAELTLSDARVADVRSRVRRELERDLHDGAQQRLIALRMKVSVLNRLLDQDVRRAAALARELGPDLEATLEEVRELSHGRGPRLLAEAGLGAALADAVTRAPLPVALSSEGVGRYPDAIESAAYFGCLEGLQNAGKHAGSGSSARIRLVDDGTTLTFSVADDGQGSMADADLAGQGMANVRERLAAVGGDFSVMSSGEGLTVTGSIPLP